MHNFVADKAKIRRRAAARQGFLTQYAAKFAEKTCAYAYEDRFLAILVKFVDYLFKMNASARLEKHNIARTELEFKEVEYL